MEHEFTQSTPAGLSVRIDQFTETDWNAIVERFDDASLYQTWAYGAARSGEANLSHVVLEKDGMAVAAAQARLKTVPLVGAGIAYIYWGPMWRLRDQAACAEIFQGMLQAMWQEYVVRRGLVLRILPREVADEEGQVRAILERIGFVRDASVRPHTTYIMDLSPSLDDLLMALRKSWRSTLRQSDRDPVEFSEGTDENLYESFLGLYEEMHARKGFQTFVDPNEFREIQKRLPEALKMRILIACHQGRPVGAEVWSEIGNTALSIFAASSDQALQLKSMYSLRWQMVTSMKQRGAHYLDLGGVNPEKAPGPALFKAGLAGKNPPEIQFVGTFQGCRSPISGLVVRGAEKLRGIAQGARARSARLGSKTQENQ